MALLGPFQQSFYFRLFQRSLQDWMCDRLRRFRPTALPPQDCMCPPLARFGLTALPPQKTVDLPCTPATHASTGGPTPNPVPIIKSAREAPMRLPVAAASILLILALPGATKHAPRFNKVSIPTGNGPRWTAVADINHDGHPDLIVANDGSETLSVLLGDGKGHFQNASGSPVPAGHLPNDIAVADMNHDGNPDLVIANHQSPYLRILLGDGKGGFHPGPGSPIDVHSNPHPHAVAVGAFSASGNLDVVTDSWGNNQIELLQGDGKGGLVTL